MKSQPKQPAKTKTSAKIQTISKTQKPVDPLKPYLNFGSSGRTNPIKFSNIRPMESGLIERVQTVLRETGDSEPLPSSQKRIQFLDAWGIQGSGDGAFYDPKGIAVDPDGNIYVADSGNKRIQKFDYLGRHITNWGMGGSENTKLGVEIICWHNYAATMLDGLTGKVIYKLGIPFGSPVGFSSVDVHVTTGKEENVVFAVYNSLAIHRLRDGHLLKSVKLFDIAYSPYNVLPSTYMEVGDIDGDGEQEIVVTFRSEGPPNVQSKVRVFDLDGNELWQKDLVSRMSLKPYQYSSIKPIIGDINGDGIVEIIVWDGPDMKVFDPKGRLLWQITTGWPTLQPLIHKTSALWHFAFLGMVTTIINATSYSSFYGNCISGQGASLMKIDGFNPCDLFTDEKGSMHVAVTTFKGRNALEIYNINGSVALKWSIQNFHNYLVKLYCSQNDQKWKILLFGTLDGTISQLDALSGSEEWKAKFFQYNQPLLFKKFLIAVDRRTWFIFGGIESDKITGFVCALGAETQDLVWSYNVGKYINGADPYSVYYYPIIFDNLGGDRTRKLLFNCTKPDTFNPATICVHVGTGEILWSLDGGAGQNACVDDFNNDGVFNNVSAILVDDEKNIFVVDSKLSEIFGYDSNCKYKSRSGRVIMPDPVSDSSPLRIADSFMTEPIGIAKDEEGRIWVVDYGSNQIKVIFQDNLTFSFGSKGTAQGQFEHPEGIALGIDGSVYICDTGNHRVQKFDREGKVILEWGKRGSANGEFDEPCAIAIDAEENVYVVDRRNHRVQVFTKDGNYLRKFGQRGTGEGEFESPCGIAINKAKDYIYVSDTGNHRIQMFRVGTEIGEFSLDILDMRPAQWLAQLERLQKEKIFAATRYMKTSEVYDLVLSRQEFSPSELDSVEGRMRIAFDRKLAAERRLEDFLTELSTQGFDINTEDGLKVQLRQRNEDYKREANLIANAIQKTTADKDSRTYTYINGEYIDQFGISLYDFVVETTRNPRPNLERILTIPLIDNSQSASKIMIVRNPVFGGRSIHAPAIYFEECFSFEIIWEGIGVGEFVHSVNLFPGESRELQLVSTKKRSWQRAVQTSEKTAVGLSSETAEGSTRNDDFISSLQSAFDESQNFQTSRSLQQNSTKTAEVGGGFSLSGFGLNFNANKKTSTTSTYSASSSSSLSNIAKRTRDLAMQTNREISANNRVTFSGTTDTAKNLEQKVTATDSESETQLVKVSNINQGRSMNFNFFQMINRYATELRIENLRIHVATGIEIIAGTGITLEKHCDIENAGRAIMDIQIYSKIKRQELLRIVGLQIARRYLFLEEEDAENLQDDPMIVTTADAGDLDIATLRRRCRKMAVEDPGKPLRYADDLIKLMQVRFRVRPAMIGKRESYAVNSGKYYVDAHIGFLPATEPYLEERRRIETDHQFAKVEEIKERTKKNIFFSGTPKEIQSLSIVKKKSSDENT